MTTELYAMVVIGLAIVGLNWRMYAALREDVRVLHVDMTGVKERLSALEATVGLIVQGLHIEVKSKG